MQSGITVRAFVLSTFALDGGAMHGIIPRPLWERVHTPDDKNRIQLVARALLVDNERSGTRALIELGMGQRWSAKERAIYALDEGDDPPEILRRGGVDPDTITHVLLTHAHWDHAGGLLRSGTAGELSFPRAEHVLSEGSLGRAMKPAEKDAGSFRRDDIEALVRLAKLRVIRGGDSILPGIEHRISNGHTEGLMIPIITARDDGPPLAMPTDLIPTRSHLKPTWVMGYDNEPLRVVEEKRALVEELARIGGRVALYHDPVVEAAGVVSTPKGLELVPSTLHPGPAPKE